MKSFSLQSVAAEQLEVARSAHSGRSADALFGSREHALRQTVIALVAGAGLQDHESPGEATLQVLTGRVRLRWSTREWEGTQGDFVLIPAERHALDAVEDSAVLLTTVKVPHPPAASSADASRVAPDA
jgi:quercetin dioxygenase-like cupin family protein